MQLYSFGSARHMLGHVLCCLWLVANMLAAAVACGYARVHVAVGMTVFYSQVSSLELPVQ